MAVDARPPRGREHVDVLSDRSFLVALDSLPSASPGRTARLLWAAALASGLAGLIAWGVDLAFDSLGAGIVALWCFTVAAVAVALVLPLPWAVLSPLYMGIAGWLVDMLPFVILAGWAAVVARWGFGLWQERRRPRGGRWIWLPLGLAFWTTLGVISISTTDFKHFLLLFGIQIVLSGVLLLAVDSFVGLEERTQIAAGLVLLIVVLSVAVLFEWIGVPVESLQDETVSTRAEAAYGVNAFPNETGMIKYSRSSEGGLLELKKEIDEARVANPEVPPAEAFRPKFRAYTNQLLVRFDGPARDVESDLADMDVVLLHDNVGVAPANTIPRLRSFPRNALTYAGVAVAVLPLALYLAWAQEGRRKRLGQLGVAACLFGAGFSLVRGAWVAIAIGLAYLLVDGFISWRLKWQAVAWFAGGALVLTVIFVTLFHVDPINARAGAEGSVKTRSELYTDTVDALSGFHFIIGFGSEAARGEGGTSRTLGRYVPRAGTHSTYLNYLFRTGVPGALAIAAIYGLAALHARAAARDKGGRERIFSVAVTVSVLTAAAHAVILNLYTEPFYTLAIGLVLGLAMAGSTSLSRSIWPWRTAEQTA